MKDKIMILVCSWVKCVIILLLNYNLEISLMAHICMLALASIVVIEGILRANKNK